jgi:ElaB/YqjD/DUF883 family membrane-anchored ribosome-binding protein
MAKANDPRMARRPGEGYSGEYRQSFDESRQRNAGLSDDRSRDADNPQSSDEWRARERAGEFVSENPYSSVLTGFGLGFGFGLVVTLLLSRREETWYERHIPESLQEWPDRLRKGSEKVASQVSQAWNRW